MSHSNIIVDRLQGCGRSKKSCGKVKVSHAAVKSFDRRGVSCENARTVQFSVTGEVVRGVGYSYYSTINQFINIYR